MQSVAPILAGLLGLVLAALAYRLAEQRVRARATALAAVVALIVGVAIAGAGSAILAFIVVAALVGAALDAAGRPRWAMRAAAIVAPLAVVAWRGAELLAHGPTLAQTATMVALWFVGAAIMSRFLEPVGEKLPPGGPVAPAIELVAAALALAALADIGGTGAVGALALVIAAAAGGVVVWGYGATIAVLSPFDPGATGYLAFGVGIIAAAGALALPVFAVDPISLALVAVIFVTRWIARPSRLEGRIARILGPVGIVLVTMGPAIGALLIAFVAARAVTDWL